MSPLKITPKRVRLAFRSPGHFSWAVRHVLRGTPLGALERRLLRGRSLRPNLFVINITGRCNLRCAMCMQPRGGAGGDDSATVGAGRRGELSPGQWKRVIDQAAPAHPAFYFSGGEPLLYKGLDEILEHIKRRGLIAALVTNATRLERHAERLVEIGVDNVTVSLDGPQAVHDSIRGLPGAFEQTLTGVRALQDARRRAGAEYPKIKINCVITPMNVAALYETYEIVRDLDVNEFNLQHPMFDTADNVALHNRVFPRALGLPQDASAAPSKRDGEFYEERLTPEQFGLLEAFHGRVRSERRSRPTVLFFPVMDPKDWRGYYLDLEHDFRRLCAMPWTTMRLLADGTFEPCLHYVVGNVADTPVWDLWNHKRMRHFRRALARNKLFPACARCCYRAY